MRIDHRAGTLRFGAPGLDSDRMRDHIAVMARRLQQAQRMYSPAVDPALEERRLKVAEFLIPLKHIQYRAQKRRTVLLQRVVCQWVCPRYRLQRVPEHQPSPNEGCIAIQRRAWHSYA